MLVKECPKFHSRFLLLAIIFGLGLSLISCSTQTKETHIAQGEEFLQKRKFEEALMEFRAAADIDKKSPEAHWGLARVYEKLGKFYETVEELHRVVEFQPDNLEAKSKLGNYFLLFNPPQTSETEKLLREIFSRDPNFIEGHILKASLYAVQGKPEKDVLDVLNYAISIDPNRTESYISMARYFMKIEKAEEAENAIRKGIEVTPNLALGYIEYGRFLTFAERFSESETQFIKAIEVEPKNIEAREAIAEFYIAQKQFDKAEQTYQELVKIEGNSPESRMGLGGFYSILGRNDDASKVFEGILADNPNYIRARYRLSEIYLEQKEIDKAAEQVNEMLAVNDGDYEALLLRARIKLQDNKAGEAVKDLEEILKKTPRLKDALFYMAQAKLTLGQISEARAFIGDLEKFYPSFLRADLLNIQASFSAGEIERALRQANELLRLIENSYKNNPESGKNNAQAQAELKIGALTARGLAYLQLGNTADARKDLQEVANNAPDSASAMVNLAKVFIAENNLNEATNLYDKALVADGKNFDALTGMVNVLNRQKRFDDAQAKVDQKIEQNADRKDILAALHYLKSDIYRAASDFASAENELKTSLELDDSYLPSYSAYASLLIARNQTDAAVEQYKKALEKRPSASVYTLIGMLEDSRQNTAQAEENYRKALELEPESPIASNNLAWLIVSNNRENLDEALRLAQTSVNQSPNSAGYYDTLGWVYYKKGLYSPAVEQFKKAVALDNASAAKNGEKPNAEYRQRLSMAMTSASSEPTV